MPIKFSAHFVRYFFLLLVLGPVLGFTQPSPILKPGTPAREKRIKGQKPYQSDVLKVDLFQPGINEVRISYELEVGKHSSLEFGLGAIYKNGFWYDRGDRPMLAYGGGVYFAFRKYMDKKKYFSEPKVRSYISPMIFYRYSSYKNEWIAVTTSDPNINDCFLYSEKIHQAAVVIRFGWQTARGRLVLDFYSGLGFKFIPSIRTATIMTPLTAVCLANSTSITLNSTEKSYPTNVIINAGIKFGIRRNNKERHYEDVLPVESGPDPEAPPQF